ncbi:MAG: SEC-C domain-containing protein [Bacilli bacterium]|nr:SEC-C domain-containing protein [Bacilli bacterium]
MLQSANLSQIGQLQYLQNPQFTCLCGSGKKYKQCCGK